MSVSNYTIISHLCLDGIIASAIMVRKFSGEVASIKVHLIGVSRLQHTLERYYASSRKEKENKLIILDLNPQYKQKEKIFGVLEKISETSEVIWLDHHKWDQEYLEKISKLGVKVEVNQKMTSAELALKYTSLYDDYHALRLAKLSREAEYKYEKTRDKYALKWRKLLKWYGKDPNFRREVLNLFIQGRIWSKWAEEKYRLFEEEYPKQLEKFLKSKLYPYTHIETVNDTTLVIAPIEDKFDIKDICEALLNKFKIEGKHIIFLVKTLERPRYVSLRASRNLEITNILKMLGGGGRRTSGGAPLRTKTYQEALVRILQAVKESIKEQCEVKNKAGNHKG